MLKWLIESLIVVFDFGCASDSIKTESWEARIDELREIMAQSEKPEK